MFHADLHVPIWPLFNPGETRQWEFWLLQTVFLSDNLSGVGVQLITRPSTGFALIMFVLKIFSELYSQSLHVKGLSERCQRVKL